MAPVKSTIANTTPVANYMFENVEHALRHEVSHALELGAMELREIFDITAEMEYYYVNYGESILPLWLKGLGWIK